MEKLDKNITPIDASIVLTENNIKISDEDILEYLKQSRETSIQFQEQRAGKRRKWYKEYKFNPYGNERSGLSTSVKSVIWDTVQGCIPGLLEIFTGDFFTLKSDNAENAEKLHKLIKYQMLVKNNGEEQLDDFIHNSLIYEFGILKIYYKNEYEEITEIIKDEIDENTLNELSQRFIVSKYTPVEYTLQDGSIVTKFKDIKITKRDVVYSGPVMENIAPWEFYISPGANTVDDAKYVGHWVKRNLDYIQRREKAGIYRKGSLEEIKLNLGKINEGINSELEDEEHRGIYDTESLSDVEYTQGSKISPSNELWIKEEYIKIDLDNDGLLENAIIVTCNDVILSISENPYKRPPFRLGKIIPEPHKVTGVPFTELLSNDQKTQTMLTRLLIDGAAFSTYKNPITNDPSLLESLRKRKPFDTIYGNTNSISFLEVPPPSQSTFNTLEYSQGMVENKTGITRYNQGLDANSLNKTATGINIITSASQQKQKLFAKRLGRTLVQVVRDFIFINQTWPPENTVNIVGTELQIDMNDLRGEYTIEPVLGIGPQEKAFASQRIMNFINMALSNSNMSSLVNPVQIRNAIEYMGKLEEVPYERFISSEKEITDGTNNTIQQLQQQNNQLMSQIQQIGNENNIMKQKLGEGNNIEIQLKQYEIDSRLQLEKYKADLKSQTELKIKEMELMIKEKEQIEQHPINNTLLRLETL